MASETPAVECLPYTARLSANAAAVWAAACKDAADKGHAELCTEHLLWHLCSADDSSSRGAAWLKANAGLDKAKVLTYMTNSRALDFFHEEEEEYGYSSGAPASLRVSPSCGRVLAIANRLAGGEVEGIGDAAQIDTERLFAAMMAEGTCVASRILDDVGFSVGASLTRLLAALEVPESMLLSTGAGAGAGGGESKTGASAEGGDGWTIDRAVDDDAFTYGLEPPAALPKLPTEDADVVVQMRAPLPAGSRRQPQYSYIVPGRVLHGPAPVTRAGGRCVADMLALGVTTFVDLRHESFAEAEYFTDAVSGVKGLVGPAKRFAHNVDYLHFGIPDFAVKDVKRTKALLDELKARVEAGHVLYIHCRSGHGRTGTIVVSLLAALYDDLARSDAYKLVLKYHAQRAGCSEHCPVPEELVQKRQIYAVTTDRGKT